MATSQAGDVSMYDGATAMRNGASTSTGWRAAECYRDRRERAGHLVDPTDAWPRMHAVNGQHQQAGHNHEHRDRIAPETAPSLRRAGAHQGRSHLV